MFSKFLLFLFLTNKNKNIKKYIMHNEYNKCKFNNIHSNLLLSKY